MRMAKAKWKLLFKVPGGHKYFADEEGDVAVADDSGRTPDETEDGILYVVRDKPIRFGQHATITVKTPKGTETTIMESAEGGILVAVNLEMNVNACGQNFHLQRWMAMPD